MTVDSPHSVRGAATAVLRTPTKAPLGLVLRVVSGESKGRQLRLSEGECLVGAGSGADLVVKDSAVSRRHAKVRVTPEGAEWEDLNSRNGSFYLEQRINSMVLGLGSRVRIGGSEIAIEADLDDLQPQSPEVDRYRDILGRSPEMHRLFGILRRLEGTLVNVLVQGESGVGKELVARALHDASRVAQSPFVVVNCGAISRELVLSELFGHKKGAFTGASDNRRGAFEAADGGTLFLDEIGELPLDVQPALLRAIELGEIKPLGATETKRVKVRLVAATNRHLLEMAKEKLFREDLYYRLAVVKLEVPALRRRLDDVPLLANVFAQQEGGQVLPTDVMTAFQRNDWPGNVRELKNAVLAYQAIGSLPEASEKQDGLLELGLEAGLDVTVPYQELKDAYLLRFSRIYLEKLMDHAKGNQSQAARISGLDRSYIGKLLNKHGLSNK